jgi:hypothetical protein
MIQLSVRGRVVDTVDARALASVPAPTVSWGATFFGGLLGLFEPLVEVA